MPNAARISSGPNGKRIMTVGAAQAARMLLATGAKPIAIGAMRIAAGEKVATVAGTPMMAAAGAKDAIARAACLQDTCHRPDSAESGITTDRQVISRRPATAAGYLAACRTTHV
jgi:hypothetical protein